MTNKEAISILKGENELICLNPLTGEIDNLDSLNDLNKRCFEAHNMAIEALEKWVRYEKLLDVVVENGLMCDWMCDEMRESGDYCEQHCKYCSPTKECVEK